MKLYKTWEILKMIDEDYENIKGEKFKLINKREIGSSLLTDCEVYVGESMTGIKGLFTNENISMVSELQGPELWEKVKIPVDFMVAFRNLRDGMKDIYCLFEGREHRYMTNYKGLYQFDEEMIDHGKWYIK